MFRTTNPALPGLAGNRAAASVEQHAPSVSLPLRFVLTGMLALFTGVIGLVARPDILATYHYNQYVIALTHLFTLGWITSVIMGAMYQLVPVALETRLYSERLARWQFALHVVGLVGMVSMFWVWNPRQVGHFGSIMALGILLFVYNLGRTLKQSPRRNVIATAIAAALFWLLLTMVAGLYLAAAKCWTFSPFAPLAQMHAHAHLGVLGFFVMMIVGVSFKLVPMFGLSEVQNARRAAWSIGLLNAGLVGLFVTLLIGSAWKLAFALVVIGGLAVYGWELIAILRARKRRHLDWGLRYFLTAVLMLAPLSVIGLVLAWPGLPATAFTTQLENVYGFLALIGLVTLAILGMLYKIVPFLVWYHRYSPEIGRRKVPALADLYSAPLQAAGFWLYLAGLLAASVSTALGNQAAVRWSCVLLAGSLLLFAVNMGKILSHLVRPQIQPLGRRVASAGIA
ncbi:MAG: cbb3-type cytochrome c oxidase subunit I [Limisphaerales bacterium]